VCRTGGISSFPTVDEVLELNRITTKNKIGQKH